MYVCEDLAYKLIRYINQGVIEVNIYKKNINRRIFYKIIVELHV